MDIVGGSLLSAFLQVFFERMAKPEFLSLFRDPKYDVRGPLKKLKFKLLILQPVLDDAENKQTKEPAIKEWLDELQDVVYQADDLLDEINTEALRIKIESQYQISIDQASASKVISNFSIEFLKEIVPRIEDVVNSLEEFIQQIHVLGLVKKGESKKRQPFRLSSTSLVDESDVYGRDSEKDKIIGELLSDGANGENITVISVVGLGGLGKTTLAQLLYNDKSMRQHFEIKAWVCISEVYDTIRITKDLLQELEIPFNSEESFNSLQVKLKKSLFMKRFLIVLDDVWNRDYNDWQALSSPFSGGKEGSKILVTTRDLNVARVMCNGSIHYLSFMSDEDSWGLFKKHAMNRRDPAGNLEFESIGKDILRKCGGLPLAVKAIAGVLRLKETAEEWKEILRSDEWEETTNHICLLPSLKLSYNDLPPQLKRCFALCAVFPKDSEFRKDEVIWLWMANGLLDNPKSNKRLEDRGDEFFRELRSRSLFQRSSDGTFSMHDLFNDLAKFVSGKHVYRQEDQQKQNTSLIGVRHFSYLSKFYNEYEKFKLLNEARFLRSFFPINIGRMEVYNILSRKLLHEILPTLKSLRFLSLVGSSISELPKSIENLKQLRFLNLSSTEITKLPSQICTLYNLQTLLLANCYQLEEYPEEMEKLVNLRYLDLGGVRVLEMPMQIERLKCLQFLILSSYTIGRDVGSRIENLGKLCNLYGELTIFGLENVVDASMARIKDKKHIKKLHLNWSGDSNDSQVLKDVLDSLQPHFDIKALEIEGYSGTRLSNWLGDSSYCYVISLCLSDCKNCFCLPALGQLPSLKYLTIRRLGKVLEIGQEVYGDTSVTKPFPCLEELKFEKMYEWKKWHIPENGAFTRLEVLSIVDCPKLMGEFSRQLPSLKKFKICGCPGLVAFDGRMTIFDAKEDQPEQFSSLRELVISNMPNLKELSASLLDLKKLLSNLEQFEIAECPKMASFPIVCLSNTLKLLSIGCGNLELESSNVIGTSHVSIGRLKFQGSHDSLKKLLHLQPSVLFVYGSDFMSFPEGLLPASTLTEIRFYDCHNLKSLPKEMHNILPLLRRLDLFNCPEIECFPQGGFPSRLESLEIVNCEKLVYSLRDWGLQRLPSLSLFILEGSDVDYSLLEDLQLPCTLRNLSLGNHQNLYKLMTLQHLTCLEWLCIDNCPKLHSLSKEALPASLSLLVIRDCQLLKPRLEWQYGEDWPKVAHIPCIKVDDELLP